MEYFANAGKEIMVENSNQGHGQGPPRGKPTDGDNVARFSVTMDKLQKTIPYQNLTDPISRPDCWAYPDMLEVGYFQGTHAVTQSRTHFGAWCIVSSPLILGFDVTNGDLMDSMWDIITNEEAIAVNQAWAGHPG